MLTFGVDITLVEILLTFGIIIFILLVESVIIIGLLVKQLQKTKNVGMLLERLSQVLLEIKESRN